MEKGGLYNRGSILTNKSSKKVDKNHTFSVHTYFSSLLGQRIRLVSRCLQAKVAKDAGKKFAL